MSDAAQRRALRNYRSRLAGRGMARFEVLGLEGDRELIRRLARRLAEDGPEAARIRSVVREVSGGGGQRGGILAALRRSPAVGAELDLERVKVAGRKVKL